MRIQIYPVRSRINNGLCFFYEDAILKYMVTQQILHHCIGKDREKGVLYMSNSPAISIEIRPLEEDDIQAILQWNRNTDEDFLHQWSGYTAYHFPLTAEQIRKRRTLSSCRLFAALQEGKTVAAAEIDGLGTSDPFISSNTLHQKEIHSQKSAHLCRLIVSNESKSKGIGSAFRMNCVKLVFRNGTFPFNVAGLLFQYRRPSMLRKVRFSCHFI